MTTHKLSGIPWEEVSKPCAICGSDHSRIKQVFRFPVLPRPFKLRECIGCGLLFNSPRMVDLGPLYAENYYVFQEAELKRYNRAFVQLKRHLDPSHGLPQKQLDILDVGSAKGHLIHILKHLGHKARGVELSSSASEFARAHFSAKVFTGSIEEYVSRFDRQEMQHDLLWCNDVLEHVPDPVRFIKSCAMALKSGGRLILDTPNARAQAVLEGKSNWGGYNPYHIWLFGPTNIELLLGNAGFQVCHMFSYGNDESAGLTLWQSFRPFLRNTLRILGLYGLFSHIRQSRAKIRDGELTVQPMRGEEINSRLAKIPWFSDSYDSGADLAKDLRGNNLVVHAILRDGISNKV